MLSNPTTRNFFADYRSGKFSYDELLDEAGNLREHWKTFFESFLQIGQGEIDSRCNDIARLLKENGVTYNIYGDPQGLNRPWKLDPIPFLISEEEWVTIESGLKQRAELLNLILKDIYGEQKLIKNGLLPMELVYNHTGFLRQCVGIQPNHKHSLTLYAADIARSNNGKIWLVNDRTQAPSGSGYAFENRTAMARIMPEMFDGLKVRRLTDYFSSLRTALQNAAPQPNYNPRIVILTPGQSNETYFEHSYLSSFLGFALVQGSDLMVKDSCVWLKTIGGLEKVDVILRRVDDIYCDPLELKEDSQLGIPGLLQALRSGNVSIANPLGSGVLENPGLMPFLQNISRYFFNTTLIMPTIASWWCGQPKELQYVLNNIHTLVIKKINRNASGSSTSIDAATLTKEQINQLQQKIKAHPHLFVGQEKVDFAHTPSWDNNKIEPRKALFRSFLVSDGVNYSAMAGGLTRTAAKSGQGVISNQLGGMSKDTWIISPEPGRTLNVRKELAVPNVDFPSNMLPSHTAENLFWVGRYAERILSNARFQRTIMQIVADGNKPFSEVDITTEQHLLESLTQCTYTYPGFVNRTGSKALYANPWKELRDILFNEKRIGSLSSNLLLFTRSVHAVRDHWSTDTWRVLRDMEEEWNRASEATLPTPAHLKLLHSVDNLITSMVAFVGLNRESISREQGWIMLDMGRKIELSISLITMLRFTLVWRYDEQVEYDLQEAILVSNECLVNYRYKYRAHLQLPLVLELMLLDSNNPRSLMYQITRLKRYLSDLPKVNQNSGLAAHERIIVEIYSLLQLADKNHLATPDLATLQYKNLETFLSKINDLLLAITSVVSGTYFIHAQAQKQLFAGNITNQSQTASQFQTQSQIQL